MDMSSKSKKYRTKNELNLISLMHTTFWYHDTNKSMLERANIPPPILIVAFFNKIVFPTFFVAATAVSDGCVSFLHRAYNRIINLKLPSEN